MFSVFKDENTPSPFVEEFGDPEANAASKPDHIYMDAMGFGMGDPCLQATFQAYDLEEAQHLYDELASITPIMVSVILIDIDPDQTIFHGVSYRSELYTYTGPITNHFP